MYATPILSSVNARYGNNRWFAFSPRLKRNVHLFSDLEYDNWLLVEMNPSTKTFCEQPLRITREISDRLYESVPDMWVLAQDGSAAIIEVKYSYELDPTHKNYNQRSARQVKIQSEWCAEHGINYIVRDETCIRSNLVYLSNLRTLTSHMRQHGEMNELEARRVLDALNKQPITMADLCSTTGLSQSRILEAVSWLYQAGAVSGNFDKHFIGHTTEVWTVG